MNGQLHASAYLLLVRIGDDASKEVGLEVNTEKTKYMSLSRHQNAGQNYDIEIANRCFENVAKFRYLGTTITNQNMIQEEIKSRVMLATIQSSPVFSSTI
jgi:ribosomal protein S2